MKREDVIEKILDQLKELLDRASRGPSWEYNRDTDVLLERLHLFEEKDGNHADKKLYKRIRKILKSEKTNDMRKFVGANLPTNFPNVDAAKKNIEQASDDTIRTWFWYFAIADITIAREKSEKIEQARIDAAVDEFWETKIKPQMFPTPKFLTQKELEEINAKKAQEFVSSIEEHAKILETNSDDEQLWKNLAIYLKRRDVRKDYLAKAVESVYNKEVDCHVRTKRELAKLLIEHGAPTAAEKVLDGVSLDPFA
jgi:hypothetical protein